IDQEAASAGVDQIGGAGDFPRRPKKMQLQCDGPLCLLGHCKRSASTRVCPAVSWRGGERANVARREGPRATAASGSAFFTRNADKKSGPESGPPQGGRAGERSFGGNRRRGRASVGVGSTIVDGSSGFNMTLSCRYDVGMVKRQCGASLQRTDINKNCQVGGTRSCCAPFISRRVAGGLTSHFDARCRG